MTTINGIDPIAVNNLKVPTQKPAIIKTQKTKVSDETTDHKDKDEREHSSSPSSSELIYAIERLNELLEQHNIPLYLEITDGKAGMKIQLMNAASHAFITEVQPQKVLRLAVEFNPKGFTIDELL